VISVEVIRAWPHRFDSQALALEEGARVADALERAGWVIDDEFVGVAIFGLPAALVTRLQDGDRVELLRPLQLDPKQARRQRARKPR